MDARALRRGLPDATSRVLAATSRGPVARAAARALVAGESIADAERVTAEQVELERTVSWYPLLKPATAADDILTARESMLSAITALAAAGVESPDLTLDVGHFGVFADDVTAGLLVVSLREVCQAARNAGVTLTLTISDPAYIEAVYVIGSELRQDFPEVGFVLPTRLRTAPEDALNHAVAGSRVRLSTARLDPSLGTTSARESGRAFVDITKSLLDAYVRLEFETDDVLLLDIASSLVQRRDVRGEVTVPFGTPDARIADLEHPGMPTRVVVPYGTHTMGYLARLVAARPALALPLHNPMRRRR